jgi:NAD(P)H dehydrogenase (quinone)
LFKLRWGRIDVLHNNSHIAAPVIAVAYHSGFGHTAVLADAVAAAAKEAGAHVSVIAVDAMTDDDWDDLDGADGIVFGCATYMGNVSAAFQAFTEQTGRRCMTGTWRDKVAAGFTNSGARSGDKLHTLTSLAVFAAQHHMHWVSLGLPPGWNSSAGSEDDLNRLGFFLGAGAQTNVDVPPEGVHPSDIATCRHLGQRVTLVTRQLNLGRAASSPEASSAPVR